MLFSNHHKDRYCQFSYNAMTDGFELGWVCYADGTYEPERRGQDLNCKWKGDFGAPAWWYERKPADWLPWENGFGFAWNHTLGESDKPADWGRKTDAEREAGAVPYFMELETGFSGRIVSRTERINGRRETWSFKYDGRGCLTACAGQNGWGQDYEYDNKARRQADYVTGRAPFLRVFEYDEGGRLTSAGNVAYGHDENGFRNTRIENGAVTLYHYDLDFRLLGVELPGGRIVEYEHDDDGLRSLKKVDGQPVEAFEWLDMTRLSGFFDGQLEYVFVYAWAAPLPYAMRVEADHYALEYDQAGSLKAVVDENGTVAKAVQYDPFGIVLWDSNPGLHVPLSFAGGLNDVDTGLVRFGGRDYDPDTGRWTAPYPCAGSELCLIDPVNMAPASLFSLSSQNKLDS